MKRFVFYDTRETDKGAVRRVLTKLTSHPFSEKEALQRVVALPGRKHYWDLKWAEPRVLRLPDEEKQRAWFVKLADPENVRYSHWPAKWASKVYLLVEKFREYENVDAVVGTFRILKDLNAYREPHQRVLYFYVRGMRSMYFTSERPKDKVDMWGLRAEGDQEWLRRQREEERDEQSLVLPPRREG